MANSKIGPSYYSKKYDDLHASLIENDEDMLYDYQFAYYDDKIIEYKKKIATLNDEMTYLIDKGLVNHFIDEFDTDSRFSVIEREKFEYMHLIQWARKKKVKAFENIEIINFKKKI